MLYLEFIKEVVVEGLKSSCFVQRVVVGVTPISHNIYKRCVYVRYVVNYLLVF